MVHSSPGGHGRPPQKSPPSFRSRLYLLICLTALPAFGLAVYSDFEERRLAILEARAANLDFARRVADGEERLIEITRLLLESLGQDAEAWQRDEAACRERFEAFLDKYPRYADSGVVARDGRILCSARPALRADVRERSWFRSVVQSGEFSIGEYEFVPGVKKAVLVFALPAGGETERADAVIFATLDLSWLNRFVSRSDLPAGSAVTIIDRSGVILAHYPDPDAWVGRSAKATDLFQRVVLQGVTRAVGLDETPLIYAFAELPSARELEPVSVIVGIPEEHVFSAANRTVVRNLGFLALALVPALLFGWLGSARFLVQPLRSLGSAAARLAGGDLNVRTHPPHETREIHQLAAAFDAMAESLQQLAAEQARGEAALKEEAAIASALAEASKDLISTIDARLLLDRLCQSAARVLGASHSETYLKRSGARRLQRVASWGLPQHGPEDLRALEVDPAAVSELDREDVVMLDPSKMPGPTYPRPPTGLAPTVMCMALRRGPEVVGFQTAGYWSREHPPDAGQIRVGRGLSQVASLALANASVLEELEAASRVKTDFLATMSHELRTPCHIIVGYLQLVLDESLDPVTPKQRRALLKVENNVRELLDLINTTLDLSRLEAGQTALSLQEFSLRDLLREIQLEAEPLLREKTSVEFGCRVASGVPPLFTDRAKLKITLKNLVNNAVKFTERGRIEIDVKTDPETVTCSVVDTGVGIAPDVIPVVFEMFRQGDGSVSRQYGGTGLGLHIVKRMVELLNGTVSVESQLGRGSTFTVRLPVRHEAAKIPRVA